MSNLVCLSDGNGNAYFFTGEERAKYESLKYPPSFDDITTIIGHFFCDNNHIQKAFGFNVWEYDLIRGQLYSISMKKRNDDQGVLRALQATDFSLIAGDLKGMQMFLRTLIRHPIAPSNKPLEDTDGIIVGPDRKTTYHLYMEAATQTPLQHTVSLDNCVQVIGGITASTPRFKVYTDVESYCRSNHADMWKDVVGHVLVKYLAKGLEYEQTYADYIAKRWKIISTGYSILSDYNGIIYAYPRLPELVKVVQPNTSTYNRSRASYYAPTWVDIMDTNNTTE